MKKKLIALSIASITAVGAVNTTCVIAKPNSNMENEAVNTPEKIKKLEDSLKRRLLDIEERLDKVKLEPNLENRGKEYKKISNSKSMLGSHISISVRKFGISEEIKDLYKALSQRFNKEYNEYYLNVNEENSEKNPSKIEDDSKLKPIETSQENNESIENENTKIDLVKPAEIIKETKKENLPEVKPVETSNINEIKVVEKKDVAKEVKVDEPKDVESSSAEVYSPNVIEDNKPSSIAPTHKEEAFVEALHIESSKTLENTSKDTTKDVKESSTEVYSPKAIEDNKPSSIAPTHKEEAFVEAPHIESSKTLENTSKDTSKDVEESSTEAYSPNTIENNKSSNIAPTHKEETFVKNLNKVNDLCSNVKADEMDDSNIIVNSPAILYNKSIEKTDVKAKKSNTIEYIVSSDNNKTKEFKNNNEEALVKNLIPEDKSAKEIENNKEESVKKDNLEVDKSKNQKSIELKNTEKFATSKTVKIVLGLGATFSVLGIFLLKLFKKF